MLKTCELHRIEYKKDSTGEITERVIIPSFVPLANVKAIDVTDLEDEKREELRALYEEYSSYVKERSQTIFSFEDWAAQTSQVHITPKWRTFKQSGLKELD